MKKEKAIYAREHQKLYSKWVDVFTKTCAPYCTQEDMDREKELYEELTALEEIIKVKKGYWNRIERLEAENRQLRAQVEILSEMVQPNVFIA